MEITLKGAGGFVKIDPSGITIQGTLVKINSGGAAGVSSITASAALPAAPMETEQAVFGADTVYTLRLSDGVEMHSLMPSRYDYRIGSEVGIEIDIDHFILFPVEPIVVPTE